MADGKPKNAKEWLNDRLDYSKYCGSHNVVIGYHAGESLTSGSHNVCIGVRAGKSISTESGCVCIGDDTDIVIGQGDNRVVINPHITLAQSAPAVATEALFSKGLFLEKNKRRFSKRWLEWVKNRMEWFDPREKK